MLVFITSSKNFAFTEPFKSHVTRAFGLTLFSCGVGIVTSIFTKVVTNINYANIPMYFCNVKKELTFTNISKDTATILIYKEIGGESGVNGSDIAQEIQMINEYWSDEVKCINIRINSPGGSVQDGLSICSAILNSEIPCDTYIDGMAYSMAGVIAMCGRNKSMVDYGTFMMHNVQGGTDDEVIDLLTNSLAKIFERTTVLTIDKCRELMSAETWMSSEQCMSMGLIDNIINTNNRKPEVANNTLLELVNFYNGIINKKSNKMTNLTNLLKLTNEASEEAIIEAVTAKDNAINELKSEIEAKDAEKEALQAKLTELEATIAEKETAEKVEVIENAVKEGKVDAATKDIYVNSTKTKDELKDIFSKLKPTYTPVFDNSTTKTVTGRESWKHIDWQKKDPKGLLEMSNNNPVQYAELLKTL